MTPDAPKAAARPEPREVLARTTVVVPCYNEARRLDVERYVSFLEGVAGLRFIFVNDGSTDATARVLRSLCERAPGRATMLTLTRNSGKGEAVRRGVLRALEEGAEFVGYWDADLATPLDALKGFAHVLARRPDIELVMGARVQLLGRRIERSALRHYAGRAFATMASLVLHLPVYDTQCGAKLFRVKPDTRGFFKQSFQSSWIFDVEIIARMAHARRGRLGGGARRTPRVGPGTDVGAWDLTGAATGRDPVPDEPPRDLGIWEFPLLQWRDVVGSKVKLADFPRAALELLTIWLDNRRPEPSRAQVQRPRPRGEIGASGGSVQPGSEGAGPTRRPGPAD